MLLKDKIALVTGSTHNIGLAIARAFAREGAKVIVHSRHEADAKKIEGVCFRFENARNPSEEKPVSELARWSYFYDPLGYVAADAFSKSVNFASWFCSRSDTVQKFIPELVQRITW